MQLNIFVYLNNGTLVQNYFIFQKDLGEEAVDALNEVHQTVFDPINSADLCKLL